MDAVLKDVTFSIKNNQPSEPRVTFAKDNEPEKEKYVYEQVPDTNKSVETTRRSSFRKPSRIALVFGYLGIGHDAFFSTTNRNVPAIYNDILRALFETEFMDKKVRIKSMKTACRTPANGSALSQVIVIPNNGGQIEDRVKKINEHLPNYIICFDGKKVPPTFHPKYSCLMDKDKSNYQVFNYLLPTFALDVHYDGSGEDYRVSEELLEKVKALLVMFEGNRSFHNFTGTSKGKPGSKNSRFLISAECGKPFYVDDLELVSFIFKGENFMILQVCSIVGFVVAYIRGLATEETLCKAWDTHLMDFPCAPAKGLILDSIHYGSFNEQLCKFKFIDKCGEPYPTMDTTNIKEVSVFKEKIIKAIVQAEKTDKVTAKWVKTLSNHTYRAIIKNPDTKREVRRQKPLVKENKKDKKPQNALVEAKAKVLQTALLKMLTNTLDTIIKEM